MKRFFTILTICAIFSFRAQAQEPVDLGLSVNWAKYNVGANSIEDMGICFMGGQTIEYKDTNKCKKQCKDIVMIHIDDYSGNPYYDAATAYWGKKWRTPTLKEWTELIECCTWKWRQYQNDKGVLVKGCEVTGPNGNTIFLPARKPGDKYLDAGQCQCSTKNQRPKLDGKEKILRGKELALQKREQTLAKREQSLEKKLEALRPLDKVKDFSPALEALPLAKLPVKKVFESAEKVVQKTAEVTLKACQKQYQILHRAYKEVSSALGYEKMMNQNLSQNLARSDTIINGMAQELEKHKTALKNLTPEKCDKLAKNMRDSGCQNYGEWEKQEQERISHERAQKAQERTKTRKRSSSIGFER